MLYSLFLQSRLSDGFFKATFYFWFIYPQSTQPYIYTQLGNLYEKHKLCIYIKSPIAKHTGLFVPLSQYIFFLV